MERILAAHGSPLGGGGCSSVPAALRGVAATAPRAPPGGPRKQRLDRARAALGGVRGPVLMPPWNLHRPLARARNRQDPPACVRAPQCCFIRPAIGI